MTYCPCRSKSALCGRTKSFWFLLCARFKKESSHSCPPSLYPFPASPPPPPRFLLWKSAMPSHSSPSFSCPQATQSRPKVTFTHEEEGAHKRKYRMRQNLAGAEEGMAEKVAKPAPTRRRSEARARVLEKLSFNESGPFYFLPRATLVPRRNFPGVS